MKIEEYRASLHEDISIAANSNMSNPEDEFLKKVTDILIAGEEFEDFVECYYEGNSRGSGRGAIRLDGYALDEVDKSCCLFVTDYRGPYESSSFDKKRSDSLFDALKRFIKEATKYELYQELEESTEVFEFARNLYYEIDNITKFRLFILTDAYNNQRTKNIKDEQIAGKTVELNIWDISRIFDVVSSTTQKESVEIMMADYDIIGIPCVKGTECINAKSDIEVPIAYDGEEQPKNKMQLITYKSYLAAVPGKILCDLYLEYGARLLEGNVRSFLSVKGKVNKSIQSTIKNCPEMFFAYNNGIAATATEIDTELTADGLVITRIKDLQIVNGGQTTASIANAILTARKDEVIDLSKLKVPMKISVLDHSMSEKIIPKISEYSNSQNKVDASDFFSNHPFHIRMEDFSRKTPAPAINGNQYQQYWYYERTRGQYNQGKMKLTAAQIAQYKLRYPEKQIIKMVELAKYMEIYAGAPDKVSKGKQAIVKEFAEEIKAQWIKSDEQFNVAYFKRVVAIAIMFSKADAIIKNSPEYKSGNRNSYKANVIAYTLSIIFEYIRKNSKSASVDFGKIWAIQDVYPELEQQIRVLWMEVYDFITSEDRPTQNVTEWCKRKECWEQAKKRKWTILPEFLDTLIDKDTLKAEEKDAKKDQKIKTEVDNFKFVWNAGSKYWQSVLDWGNDRKLLYHAEQDILKICVSMYVTGHTPTDKQIKVVMKARERLIKEGMPIDF